MAASSRLSDVQVEQFLGQLLRVGVLIAASVVFVGGVLYLAQFRGTVTDKRVFRGEPAEFESVRGILQDALTIDGRGIIQLGLLLLIATPVARVFFSVVAFAIQRDATYVAIALMVLGILLFGLAGGHL
jgi:uncharacterized membrane protein